MNIPEPRTRRRRVLSITPLIDVVFILLFFFMLASSFDRWRSIDLTLVASRSSAQQSNDVQTLWVGGSAQVQWNGVWLGVDELLTRLANIEPSAVLLLRPRDGTPIQDLVKVLEMIRADGRHQVSLAVAR